jgi:hypothetical protein
MGWTTYLPALYNIPEDLNIPLTFASKTNVGDIRNEYDFRLRATSRTFRDLILHQF